MTDTARMNSCRRHVWMMQSPVSDSVTELDFCARCGSDRGSPDDEKAVVKDAERRLAESAAQPWNYDVEDACRDALAEYLTSRDTPT